MCGIKLHSHSSKDNQSYKQAAFYVYLLPYRWLTGTKERDHNINRKQVRASQSANDTMEAKSKIHKPENSTHEIIKAWQCRVIHTEQLLSKL